MSTWKSLIFVGSDHDNGDVGFKSSRNTFEDSSLEMLIVCPLGCSVSNAHRQLFVNLLLTFDMLVCWLVLCCCYLFVLVSGWVGGHS